MTVPKQLPIAAAIAGVLAAIGISVKLATSTDPLEARVDELLNRVSEPKTPISENLNADIEDLTEVVDNPGFAKLPAAKQQAANDDLASLKVIREYVDFSKKLDDLPALESIRSAKQLEDILKQLDQPVPSGRPKSDKFFGSYSIVTAAVQRKLDYALEADALENLTESVRKDYQKVISAGKQVLQQKNEPNLPARIKEVLALAENLKAPQKDKDKPLPGASRLTYATVFQMSEIENLMREWNKLKQMLEPALKSNH
jgi:hypothetical protein